MMVTEDVNIKHEFNVNELAEMGKDQAGQLDKVSTLEAELDSVKKQYASSIAEAKAGISRISTKVHSGWEFRTIKCILMDNRPLEGYRISIRTDNGHVSKRRKLTPEERQLKLTTEEPKSFVAIGQLHVDDPDWDADACEVLLYEDEFEAIRNLDVIGMRPPPAGVIEAPVADPPTKRGKHSR